MTIGNKIQHLRKERNWTQEQLAEALAVSRQTLSRWELGTSVPDTVNILKLSKLFGVTTDFLLNEEHSVNTNDSQPNNQESPTDSLKLSQYAKRLIHEKGYCAGYILAARCIPGLLAHCFIICAVLTALTSAGPLKELPFQAFIIPVSACVGAILQLAKMIAYLALTVHLKKHIKEQNNG